MYQRTDRVKRMTMIALFSALAYVVGFVLRFDVSFLTFEASDAFLTIGALSLGPVAAVLMSLLTALIEFLTVGNTGFYGFLMNFLSSAVFATVASLLYRGKRTMQGAVLALVSAVGAMTCAMLLFNLFVTPLYLGVAISDVAAMLPTLLLPFNLTKGCLNAALVMMLYKPILRAMKQIGLARKTGNVHPAGKRATVCLYVISAVLCLLSVLVFLLVLEGRFTLYENPFVSNS